MGGAAVIGDVKAVGAFAVVYGFAPHPRIGEVTVDEIPIGSGFKIGAVGKAYGFLRCVDDDFVAPIANLRACNAAHLGGVGGHGGESGQRVWLFGDFDEVVHVAVNADLPDGGREVAWPAEGGRVGADGRTLQGG